jgi:hypothetical protein
MLSEFLIIGVVHVAQMVAAVVIAIDVERLVMFTGVVDGHVGFMQSAGQLLVFAVVVRVIVVLATRNAGFHAVAYRHLATNWRKTRFRK